jgi:tRNA nucleotidyltransferase (CCA-adding enzyme)
MLKSCRILGTKQWAIFGTHAAFVCLRCRCCDVKRRIAMLLEERQVPVQMEMVGSTAAGVTLKQNADQHTF